MYFLMREYKIRNWVIFTSSAPCVIPHVPADISKLEECLKGFTAELREKCIDTIVVLLTDGDMQYYYQGKLLPLYISLGFEVIHFPIQDYGIPDLEYFIAFQQRLIKITESKRILIHCRGGIGRTGLVLAGLFITLGEHPTRAIQKVRSKVPGSVETEEQEEFLFQYYESIKGKIE